MWAEKESIDHFFVNSKFITPFVFFLYPVFTVLGFAIIFLIPHQWLVIRSAKRARSNFVEVVAAHTIIGVLKE